jgi:hypothetical protein
VLFEEVTNATIDGLIPCTRWVTPQNVPKRFTTQMYIYFLPVTNPSSISQGHGPGVEHLPPDTESEAVIPIPTADGGIEHTAARFLPAWKWLEMAQANRIILFPPQFYLLDLVQSYLSPSTSEKGKSRTPQWTFDELVQQRKELMKFLNDTDEKPPWRDKVISPYMLKSGRDGRTVLALDRAGRDIPIKGQSGDPNKLVLVSFKKEGPRNVEVVSKERFLLQERGHNEIPPENIRSNNPVVREKGKL